MPNSEDTAAENAAETREEVNGNQKEQQQPANTEVSNAPKAEETKNDSAEIVAQLEQERKARAKAEMRANQLENEREESQRKALEEQGKYKELYETLQERLDRQEAEREQAELRKQSVSLRDEVINSYENETVKRLAQKQIDTGIADFFWQVEDPENPPSESEAREQVKKHLDALAEVVGGNSPENSDKNAPPVSGSNPLTASGAPQKKETPAETLARLDAKFEQSS